MRTRERERPTFFPVTYVRVRAGRSHILLNSICFRMRSINSLRQWCYSTTQRQEGSIKKNTKWYHAFDLKAATFRQNQLNEFLMKVSEVPNLSDRKHIRSVDLIIVCMRTHIPSTYYNTAYFFADATWLSVCMCKMKGEYTLHKVASCIPTDDRTNETKKRKSDYVNYFSYSCALH